MNRAILSKVHLFGLILLAIVFKMKKVAVGTLAVLSFFVVCMNKMADKICQRKWLIPFSTRILKVLRLFCSTFDDAESELFCQL